MNPYIPFEIALTFFTTAYLVSVIILLMVANVALVVIGMIQELGDCS